jgi:hypothetical protein
MDESDAKKTITINKKVTKEANGIFSISGIEADGLEENSTVIGTLTITDPEEVVQEQEQEPEEVVQEQEQEPEESSDNSNTQGGKKGGKKNTKKSKKSKKGGKSRKNKKSGSKKRR